MRPEWVVPCGEGNMGGNLSKERLRRGAERRGEGSILKQNRKDSLGKRREIKRIMKESSV